MEISVSGLKSALIVLLLISLDLVGAKASAQAPAFTKITVAFSGDTPKSKTGDLYTPTSGKPGTWPGIVLVHGSLGVTSSIRSEAETLASHGYMVLVVDLYEGVVPSETEDGEKRWANLSERSALTICEGALGFLQSWSINPENLGAVGWRDGGSLVLEMAAEQPMLKAAVDFGGISFLTPHAFHGVASRSLIEAQQAVPDEALAIKFLDAHLKNPRAKRK